MAWTPHPGEGEGRLDLACNKLIIIQVREVCFEMGAFPIMEFFKKNKSNVRKDQFSVALSSWGRSNSILPKVQIDHLLLLRCLDNKQTKEAVNLDNQGKQIVERLCALEVLEKSTLPVFSQCLLL